MHKLHDLRDMLMRELDECTKKGEISPNSLGIIDQLTHSVKSIDTILAMEEYGDGEYKARRRDSRGRYMDGYNDGDYNAGYNRGYNRDQYGEDYNRGYNQNYNRGYNRDEYGRDQYGEYNRRRYSRDEAQHELMENLRQMEMSAGNEEQKKMIRKWISQAEMDN